MPTRKKNSRRKRKSPKVKLDTKSVFIAAAVILVLSVVYLFINTLFESPYQENSQKQNAKPAAISEDSTKQTQTPPQKSTSEDNIPAKQSSAEKSSDIFQIHPVPVELPEDNKNENSAPAKVTSGDTDIESRTYSTKTEDSPDAVQISLRSKKSSGSAKYDIPQAANGATLVFIIDDAGHSAETLIPYLNLPFPLTIAVLPKVPETALCANLVAEANKELLLHQPMQASNKNIWPGPGGIMPDMTAEQIKNLLTENIMELGPNVKGVNNHEGSLITEDAELIKVVLEVTKECGLFFLDSRTTAKTKSEQEGAKLGMHIEQRDVFLDNVVDTNAILKQIYQALTLANKNGKAIIIGHADKSADILPTLLLDMYPYLIQKGYKFAFSSALY